MSNRDFLNKYHESEPYSFGGISQVQNYFNVKKRKVANILSKSDSYTTFKEFKNLVKLHQLELMVQITFGKLI